MNLGGGRVGRCKPRRLETSFVTPADRAFGEGARGGGGGAPQIRRPGGEMTLIDLAIKASEGRWRRAPSPPG